MASNKQFMVDWDGKKTAIRLTQEEKKQLLEDLNVLSPSRRQQVPGAESASPSERQRPS